MFTLERTRPVANSTTDGVPIPTAAGDSPAATARTWATICAISASALERSVGATSGWPVVPPCSVATDVLVPPTSTPTTSACRLMARKLSAVVAGPVNLSLPLLPRPQDGDLGSIDTLGR
jgi:hypothetical protein